MKITKHFFILLLAISTLMACETELYDESQAAGLWQQVSVTEDGNPVTLTPEQQALKILIEPNGICRYYHQSFQSYNNGNGPTSFYGTWSMLDGQWVNFTTDKWQFIPTLSSDSNKVNLDLKKLVRAPGDTIIVIDTLKSVQKQWSKYHIQSRFTILKLSSNEMEIRLKTFEGEKKYAMIFAPNPEDFIEVKNAASGKDQFIPKLVTDQNYWTIRKEFQTLKTYVFKFQKVSY